MTDEDYLIQTPEPDPNQKELRDLWKTLGQTMVKDSVKTIDEVGKQLIAVDGILVGLYFNAVAFSDLHGTVLDAGTRWIYLLPIGFLLISLIAALAIFYPDRSRVDLRSTEAIKLVYERTISEKLFVVRAAALFLIFGVSSVGLALFTYLNS